MITIVPVIREPADLFINYCSHLILNGDSTRYAPTSFTCIYRHLVRLLFFHVYELTPNSRFFVQNSTC